LTDFGGLTDVASLGGHGDVVHRDIGRAEGRPYVIGVVSELSCEGVGSPKKRRCLGSIAGARRSDGAHEREGALHGQAFRAP